jgi:hypothetical protein
MNCLRRSRISEKSSLSSRRLHGTTLTMQPPLSVTGVQAANDKIKWEDIAGVTTPVIAATTVGAVVPNDVQTIPPGGRPWFVRSGDAEFTPVNGELRFKVDTEPVPLSPQGVLPRVATRSS